MLNVYQSSPDPFHSYHRILQEIFRYHDLGYSDGGVAGMIISLLGGNAGASPRITRRRGLAQSCMAMKGSKHSASPSSRMWDFSVVRLLVYALVGGTIRFRIHFRHSSRLPVESTTIASPSGRHGHSIHLLKSA